MLEQREPETPTAVKKKLCANHRGFSLHAAVRVGEGKRERLERLCRYIARPPLAQERLSVTGRGGVVYRFRHPWKNGRTAVVLDPMTFLSRLAAQVPSTNTKPNTDAMPGEATRTPPELRLPRHGFGPSGTRGPS